MPQKLWEILLTVINDKPHQFAVRELNIDDSDIGFDRDISAGYIFDGTGQSNPKENIRFVVYVKMELTDLYFDGTPKELHNEVIAFALYSIRKEPTRNEFSFTADGYKRHKEFKRKEGLALRTEILRFLYDVNNLWPSESVSYISLEDNMVGDVGVSGQWLNRLERDGLLEAVRGFKKHSRARGKPDTKGYCISDKGRKEVAKEIEADEADTKFPPSNFFKLIDLEVEQKGAFAFVIMPFNDDEFPQNVFEQIIKPAVENNLNCICVRNDEDLLPGQLDDKFYSHIVKCKFLIAELTTENLNVVYELSMAHTLNKDVVILVDKSKNGDKLKFDYDKFTTIFYSSEDDLKHKLEATIRSLGTKHGIPSR